MIGFIKNYAALRAPKRRLLREALTELVRAWYLVRFRKFNRYSRDFGQPRPGPYLEELRIEDDTIGQVRWAVDTACKPFGSRFTCLMRAMAGKEMLNRRGIRNSLTLGAKLESGAELSPTDDMKAHAWLSVGSVVLLGGEEKDDYIPVTHYVGP